MSNFRKSGWRGWIDAFGDASRGCRTLLVRHRNARVHAAAAVGAAALGAWIGISRSEWIAIALCIGLVLAAEAFNSAIEELADAVHPERHPRIGQVKDMAAAGVLLAAIASASVGAMVFLPYLF